MEFVASKQMRVLSGCVPNSERSGLGVKRGSFLKNILYNYLSLTFQNSITIRLLPNFHEKRTLQCTITGLITKKAQIQNTGLGHRLSMKLSSQTKYKQIADPIPRSKMICQNSRECATRKHVTVLPARTALVCLSIFRTPHCSPLQPLTHQSTHWQHVRASSETSGALCRQLSVYIFSVSQKIVML